MHTSNHTCVSLNTIILFNEPAKKVAMCCPFLCMSPFPCFNYDPNTCTSTCKCVWLIFLYYRLFEFWMCIRLLVCTFNTSAIPVSTPQHTISTPQNYPHTFWLTSVFNPPTPYFDISKLFTFFLTHPYLFSTYLHPFLNDLHPFWIHLHPFSTHQHQFCQVLTHVYPFWCHITPFLPTPSIFSATAPTSPEMHVWVIVHAFSFSSK